MIEKRATFQFLHRFICAIVTVKFVMTANQKTSNYIVSHNKHVLHDKPKMWNYSGRALRLAKYTQNCFGFVKCLTLENSLPRRINRFAWFPCHYYSTGVGNKFQNTTPLLRHSMHNDLKYRQDPVILKVDEEKLNLIYNEKVKRLQNIFQKYNFELRFAGGVVRLVFFQLF